MRVPTIVNPQSRPSERTQGYAQARDISNSFDQVGATFRRLGAKFEADQADREQFDVSKKVLDESIALSQDFKERQEAALLGAKDFTKSTLDAYDMRHRSLLDQARQEGLGEKAINSLALQFQNMRLGMVNPSMAFQAGSYRQKIDVDLDDTVNKMTASVLANRESYFSNREQLRTMISQIPDLTAPEKSKYFENGERVLKEALTNGLGTYEAERVLKHFAPEPAAVAPTSSAPSTPGTVASGPIEQWLPQYLDNIKGSESGGKATAKNPDSSASGLYQFTDETWAGLVRNNPNVGLTLGGRFSPEQQEIAVRLIVQEQKAGLEKAGLPVTPGNMYLSHFFGPNATAFIKADDNASAASVVAPWKRGQQIIASNKNVRTQTVGQIKAWAAGAAGRGIVAAPSWDDSESLTPEPVPVTPADAASITGKAPTDGKTGDPLLDELDANQRLAALRLASGTRNQRNAEEKAQFDLQMENATAGFLSGKGYDGTMPTEEQAIKIYGPTEGKQRWEGFKNAQEVGQFIGGMATQSADAIAKGIAALEPDGSSPATLAIDMAAYSKAQQAAQQVMQARQAAPAEYVMQYFPNVASAFANAKNAADETRAFRMLQQAQDQLGIPKHLQKPMTEDMLARDVYAFQRMTSEQQIVRMAQRREQLGAEYMNLYNKELADRGMSTEVYASAMTALRPQFGAAGANIFRGLEIVRNDKTRRPPTDQLKIAFQEEMGDALKHVNGQLSSAYLDAAEALYVFKGGRTDQLDKTLFDGVVREMLGGSASNADTGIVDLRPSAARSLWGELVKDKTILPPGTTGREFRSFVDSLTDRQLRTMSQGHQTPVTGSGKPVSATDIVDEGTFVQLAPGQYVIKMKSDGKQLFGSDGRPFVLNISPQHVKIGMGHEPQKPPSPKPAALRPSMGMMQ